MGDFILITPYIFRARSCVKGGEPTVPIFAAFSYRILKITYFKGKPFHQEAFITNFAHY